MAFFAVLGGMNGITWTQMAQYGVLIVAFLIPAIAISGILTGNYIPQLAFSFSDIVEKLNGVQTDLGFAEYTQPFVDKSILDVLFTTTNEITIDRDIIVLSTPEVAKLAPWVIALVAAGGLAAALSTASGLLLVISSSIAHDVYYRIINPEATKAQRLMVGRIMVGFVVAIAGYFGVNPPGFVAEVVAFAFGLAAASFFPRNPSRYLQWTYQ